MFSPVVRPVTVHRHVVTVGDETGPTDAVVFTETVIVAPLDMVPDKVAVLFDIGELNELIVTVGATCAPEAAGSPRRSITPKIDHPRQAVIFLA
jgi:hypothetical protein